MLEEQLASSRKRCEAVLGLENDIIKYKVILFKLVAVKMFFFINSGLEVLNGFLFRVAQRFYFSRNKLLFRNRIKGDIERLQQERDTYIKQNKGTIYV